MSYDTKVSGLMNKKMTKQEFKQFTEQKIVMLDGANGSNLQRKGMPSGVCPEQWMLEHEEVLISLQEEYLKAGTDILYAPTFTGNQIKLREYGLEDKLQEINTSLLGLSKEAIKRYRQKHEGNTRPLYVAGDLTMTGEQLYPIGTLMFEELVEVYKEQITVLVHAGADLIVVETMMSLQECRAALIAAKECCNLPVMVSLTFQEDGRTLYGTDPKTAVLVLQGLGADAVGVNCSTGPDKMIEVVRIMKQYASVPLIAKPNAGLPVLKENKTVFSMEADEFVDNFIPLIEQGVGIVGGCCGTTPDHIRGLADAVSKCKLPIVEKKKIRALTTEHKTVEIDLDKRFIIVGERINPTGKKDLQAELKQGILNTVCEMAEEQVKNGADILDINMGMNGIDEKEMMVKAIYEVLSFVDVPLSIDSSHVDVIEAALRIYPGRALINSISLEPDKLERLIPIAKKYGAMFVLLPLSEKGLPKDLAEKKNIIHTIVDAARRVGLSEEDIVVDALVNTIGANKEAAILALATISYCKRELNLATICGLSNISFGLPEREFINSTFLAFAMKEGLTMAIANPSSGLLMNTTYAADLLKNVEDADVRYIERVSKRAIPMVSKEKIGGNDFVYDAVVKGNRKKILEYVENELAKGTLAKDILDQMLIPAINDVGELFENKKYFLPQLISSAETMKLAVQMIEPMLLASNESRNLGTVVIATVAGDIHDIGKNLVALMLKNYGFRIIDLGKDVKNELIIQTAKDENADIIALSALMTTTMAQMKEVVRLRDEAGLSSKIMIGGAVITQSYSDEIGADGYSKDAGEAVLLAKRLIGKK